MTIAIDFCTPAVPGEVHKYYGYSHNNFIKLPNINQNNQLEISKNKVKKANGNNLNNSKEHKTLRSVTLTGNLSLLKKFLHLLADPIKAINEPHPATGLTCLHFAASRGHLKVVECLVEEYAVRVDSTDNEGETALLKAAYNGHTPVVEYLLNRGANIHQKDKDGWTALHNACSRGHYRIVRLLVERDAKVDVRSKMGHTPLINAASKGYMSIVEYLLDVARANPLIKNNFGEAAYDVSAAAGESYICEMLEKAGRKWWHLQHTEGVLNPSNKRASMFGANYNLLEFHVTVIVILHENQRSTSLLGLSRPQFSENYLAKSDTRGPWSLHPDGTPSSKENVTLPTSATNNHRISNLTDWFWLTDWDIDYSDPRVDPTSGWQYSKSFEDEDGMWTPVAPTSGYGWVRRRRWVRVMKRRLDLNNGNHRGENVALANMDEEEEEEEEQVQEESDYLLKAEEIIKTIKSDLTTDTNCDNETLNQDIAKYNEVINILNDSIKDDTNEFRIHQASTLIRSYMNSVDRLNNKITENNNKSIDMVEENATISEETNTAQTLSESATLETLDDDSNPWSNTIDQQWPPHTVISLFGQDREHPAKSWQPDVEAKGCMVCSRRFGLLSRRHHCRKCGQVVCDKCSPWKIFLNPSDILQDPSGVLESVSVLATQQQRVCDKCYYEQDRAH